MLNFKYTAFIIILGTILQCDSGKILSKELYGEPLIDSIDINYWDDPHIVSESTENETDYEVYDVQATSITEEDDTPTTTDYTDVPTPVSVTTEGIPTTEPDIKPKCPAGKSLFSKDDLIAAVENYINMERNVSQTVLLDFKEEVTEMKDEIMEQVMHFKEWFLYRPQHLKHILEEISQKRHKLEPVLNELETKLDQFPVMEGTINERNMSLNKLEARFRKYKTICELSCEHDMIYVKLHNRQMTAGEDYYCGSLLELQKNIKQMTDEFLQNITNDIFTWVENSRTEYEYAFEIQKQDLKRVALDQFGMQMYDILNLQDEYSHLAKWVTSIDADSVLYEFKENDYKISLKLMELEKAIDIFGRDCKKCEKMIHYQRGLAFFTSSTDDQGSVLKEILQDQFIKIYDQLDEEFSVITADLNDKLNDTKAMAYYFENHEEIKAEVQKLTTSETALLMELKSCITRAGVEAYLALSENSESLLEYIDNFMSKLSSFLKYSMFY